VKKKPLPAKTAFLLEVSYVRVLQTLIKDALAALKICRDSPSTRWNSDRWEKRAHAALKDADEIRRSQMAWANQLQQCRVCGCTDNDCRQCIEKTGEPCHWVEPNLCSACLSHLSTAAGQRNPKLAAAAIAAYALEHGHRALVAKPKRKGRVRS
jgi:hypothetical protein